MDNIEKRKRIRRILLWLREEYKRRGMIKELEPISDEALKRFEKVLIGTREIFFMDKKKKKKVKEE